MAKPYCCRNVVYCYTTVFLDELIHFRNMLSSVLYSAFYPQVTCVLRESTCSTPEPLTGTYIAPHKSFPFVDGFHDLLHLSLSKGRAAPIWMPRLRVALRNGMNGPQIRRIRGLTPKFDQRPHSPTKRTSHF
ncbi:hypothetical protein AVEN_117182-1 [Araneus ventricosus]|uniref:Uncharacterized protein n=1 Tax=Araneus ventricosus TaxID=182803 RepID=A0A4Y2AXF6_ARAVE|nr:hypothetical protein AVEN_117182-1 [Araneus ventricosus]